MSMDRLDDVTVGHACEVEGCSIVCAPNEARCYDHSVMRLIGTLFNETEMCRFNGVSCTHQATVCNENDVPMCESCFNAYRRIQRGRHYEGRSIGQMVGPHNELIRLRSTRPTHQLAGTRDQLIREATAPPVLPLVPAPTYDGGSYHRGIDWAALMEGEQEELGEEDCTCNNLDHSRFNEECPLNAVCPGYPDPDAQAFVPCGAPAECSQTLHGETVSMCWSCAEIVQERFHRIDSPAGATIGHAIASGGLRAYLGIPPMRRDEGEETE